MAQIKRLSDGALITVAQSPSPLPGQRGWAGIWECGDQRFVDPAGNLFAPVAVYAQLTPMQFYLAFTPAERIEIKASTDATVKEFWATYELAAQLNASVDPNLTSVQGGLAYLAGEATPMGTIASPILTSTARIPPILAGTPQ